MPTVSASIVRKLDNWSEYKNNRKKITDHAKYVIKKRKKKSEISSL